MKQTQEKVINKFIEIHGDKYNYSKFVFNTTKTKSIIICPFGHEFLQAYEVHIKGHGCALCTKNKKLTTEDFIKKSKENHTINYNYELSIYINAHTEIKIICPVHGEFRQIAAEHMNGAGCPKCSQSKGEKLVEMFLTKHNIKFEYGKSFTECKYIRELEFDFYLIDYDAFIEFNGIQHYYIVEIFGGKEAFDKNIIRDGIKVVYCNEVNKRLFIIKNDKNWIDYDDIEKQLNEILKELNKNKIN